MTWVPSPELTSLASRISGRRHELLARELSDSRKAVAADFARRNVGGLAVTTKTVAVWCEAFLKYGVDVTQQLLELVLKSETNLNANIADWIRAELQKNLDATASGLSASLKELVNRRGGGRASGRDDGRAH